MLNVGFHNHTFVSLLLHPRRRVAKYCNEHVNFVSFWAHVNISYRIVSYRIGSTVGQSVGQLAHAASTSILPPEMRNTLILFSMELTSIHLARTAAWRFQFDRENASLGETWLDTPEVLPDVRTWRPALSQYFVYNRISSDRQNRHFTSSPSESEEVCFTGVGLSVCLCLSVTTITKKIVDGFVPNFMGRFLGGKKRPSSCFVTIGRGMWN